MVQELMAVVNGLDEGSQQPCRDDTCTINGKSLRTARKLWENISLVTAISMNQPRWGLSGLSPLLFRLP